MTELDEFAVFVKRSLACPDSKKIKSPLTGVNIKTGDFQGSAGEYTPIPHYEELYSIDEYGNIINISRNKFISQHDNGQGRMQVGLWKNNERINYKVHRLVALTFIPNYQNLPQINHIDGNKLNNHVSNLEWVTHRENTDHAMSHGLMWYQKEKV